MSKITRNRLISPLIAGSWLSVSLPLLFVLLLTSLACALPKGAGTAGSKEMIGAIKRENPEVWHNESQVQTVESLFPDDRVSVRNRGTAILEFGSSLLIRLFNTTEVGEISGTIIGHAPGSPILTQLTLFAGGLTGRLVKPGDRASITTPGGARILVLGTEFFVTYNPLSGLTTVGNFGGTMGIVAGNVSVVIPSGYYLEVPSGGQPGVLLPINFSIDQFEVRSLILESPILALADLLLNVAAPGQNPPEVQTTAEPKIAATAGTAVTEVPVTEVPALTPTVDVRAGIPEPCTINAVWPVYYVQAGDTLFGIAQRTGTTYQDLMGANCISSTGIFAGQALRVPVIPVKPPASSLTLLGAVINDDGGSASMSDFQVFIDDFPVPWQTAQFPGTGNHRLRVMGAPGYSSGGWSGDCGSGGALSLVAGEAKTCSITFDDIAPILTLVNSVINDQGGTALKSDFLVFIDDKPAEWELPQTLVAGDHQVAQKGLSDYAAAEWTGDCSSDGSISLSIGDIKTCSIVNDDIGDKSSGTLIVKKIVINMDGGKKVASDFSFSINEGPPIPFEGDALNELTLAPGVYSVVEANDPAYTTTYDNCTDQEIRDGGSVTCFIVNDDIPALGTLIVKKTVINDGDGKKIASDFSFSVNGDKPIQFDEDGQIEMPVQPGAYSVVESYNPDYVTSYDNCTDQVIPSGGSVTCFITNDDIAPIGQVWRARERIAN